MRTYNVEITNDEEFDCSGRIIQVLADDVEEAMKKAQIEMNEDEFIYQVTREFQGNETPQPVFDYLNGTMIYDDTKN